MKNNFRLKSRLKTMLFASFLLLSFGFASAQTRTISGTVTGDDIPLPGASVTVKGKSTGTVTDFDGLYSIEASKGDILSITFVGYQKKEITVGDANKINISLVVDVKQLSEVVVVGYGTLEKKEIVGSITSLKAKDIEKVQSVSFEEALQGKAAGVQITTSQGGPGEAVKVQIRGATSISASSDPLYVIDGVEIAGQAQQLGGSGDIGLQNSSPLATIDPSNIESIEVLKDANATAIYGSRGANGVVIIKTKSGRNQKVTLEFDTSLGVQRISNQLDVLSVQEYVDYFNEQNFYDPSNTQTGFQQSAFRDEQGNDIPLNEFWKDPEDGVVKRRFAIRDWRKEVFRDAIIKKHSLGIRGGNKQTWFSGNFSYTDQEGIVKQSDFKRYAMNLNVNSKINDKLTAGLNISGGRNERQGGVSAPAEGGGPGIQSGVISNLIRAAPIQGRQDSGRIKSAPGEIKFDETGFITQQGVRRINNPAKQVNETIRDNQEMFSYMTAFLEYEPLKGLKFKSSFSGNFYYSKGVSYYPNNIGWGESRNGIAFSSTNQNIGWQFNNTLTYNKTFGSHKFTTVAGTSLLKGINEGFGSAVFDFADNNVSIYALGAGREINNVNSNRQVNGLLGIFGRINYIYKGRYVIDFTARADRASRFAPGKQWGYFPSVGAAWNVSEESFMDNVSFLSNLKLKGSIGQSGNQYIPEYQSQGAFQISRQLTNFKNDTQTVQAAAVRGSGSQNGFVLDRTANPDLTWETTTQYDFGLEFGLFNNRIGINADYFDKRTTDLLLDEVVASQGGFERIFGNTGEISNNGYELSIKTVNIDTGDFSWKTDFNISFIKNEVIDLGGRDRYTVTAPVGRFLSNDYIVQEGKPLGSMFGLVSAGVYQYSDFIEFEGLNNEEAEALYRAGSLDNLAKGDLAGNRGDSGSVSFTTKPGVTVIEGVKLRPGHDKFEDLNGDGTITLSDNDDRKIIGDSNPDHFGGITNNFKYKSFDFSFLFTWKQGNDIYNKNLVRGLDGLNPWGNRLGEFRNRWTPSNTRTNLHSILGRYTSQGNFGNSSFIEDGSHLRLANISFGYNLPKDIIKDLGLSQFRIYGALDNIYVWTKYSGYDPDVSVGWGPDRALATGVDYDAYPRARTFRLGIKAIF